MTDRRQNKALILATCCLSLFIVTLDATVVNVALPTLGKELGASVSGLQWTLDAYTLTLASLLVLAGSSGDRFGRRRMFRIGLVVFGLGSLASSLAPSVGVLIAARVLQAVGGSMLNPVSLSIITNVYTDKAARAGALGVWGAVSGVSLGFGPLVGGLLVETIGWRSIFWVNVPIVVIALVLTAVFVPESKAEHRRRFDLPGQALIIVGLAGLVFAIIEGPGLGWASPGTIAAFVIAGAALVAFVPVELKRKDPLIDPRFFSSIPFSGAFAAALLAFGGWSAFLFTNTLVLQSVRGFSPIVTGLLFMPAGLAILVLSPVSGRLVGSRGTRLPMTLSGVLLAAGAAALAFTTASTPIALVAVLFLVFGAGFGLVNAPITNTAVGGMPNEQAGAASAVASTARQIGVALGIALAGSITGASTGGKVSKSFVTDAHPLWWIVVGVGIVLIAIAQISNSAPAERSSERLGPMLRDTANA
ncbi:MFS transporter [Amnibacterium endophyticum]|uniref:MFS transporter n=1 Tax=Amnibacterium endophyticum TaxID=2109337 RepID=A0ABW4LJH9_9MICO